VGDAEIGPIRLSFNPQLRVEFRGATVTSDAGLLLPRELDKRLGLDALIERHLTDPRTGHNRQFPLPDLFRQSIYSRLAGYEDTNDAERLAEDPTFRMLASRERRETSVALTSTLHWFETEVLTQEQNYQGLARLNTALIQHAAARSATQRVTLDIDSSESPVHGAQEQSAYNGHFESVCYHPLFVFNPEGDCLAAKLRPGNVHSADGWDEVLLPIIDRYRRRGQTVVARADAAFALPALYEAMERRGVRYAIRLPANDVLERRIENLLTRSRGRQATLRWSVIGASSTRRPRGTDLDGSSPRSNITSGNCFPGWASSSRRSRGPTGPSSASTISAGRPSSGSRRARPPRTGLASPVIASGPTRCVSCLASSPTTSAISYGGWFCPSPSRAGPSRVSSSGCSRPAGASFGTLDTSCSSWPKAT
jgi:hypothetical protein